MLEIVVLDGFTLNPGDLDWAALEKLGNLTVHDYTAPEQIVARAGRARAVLTNKTPLSASTLDLLPDLRYIGVLATGYNVVDVRAATAKGITVTNVPAYSTDSVAQHTFALLLELCQHVQLHADAVQRGEWTASRDFSFWRTPLIELSGKTLGIIGLGRIGRQVARIAAGFGMQVLAYATKRDKTPLQEGFAWAEIAEIWPAADIISLHCPLLPETAGLINQATISQMKRSAILLNTSRGGLVVEQDLADALNCGRIAAAGLDVLSIEPPPATNPLLTAKNCLITPHIAWASQAARERLMAAAAANLSAWLADRPLNVVI